MSNLAARGGRHQHDRERARRPRSTPLDAEKMPGVLVILHHGNIGQLYRPAGSLEEMSRPGESRPPFEDENVYYYGQYVALVVANTFEQAQDAAFHVKVSYETKKPLVRMGGSALQGRAGDTNSAPQGDIFSRRRRTQCTSRRRVKIDYTYVTPVETHNPMEMHGTIAVWEGERLTLVRVVARRGEPSQRRVAGAGHAAGEHRRHLAVSSARASAASCSRGRIRGWRRWQRKR